MTTILCTLYNSLYLDKGLVLYDSLSKCAKDFKLYVLCMDDKCYEVLSDLNQPNHVAIRLSDFERDDEELQKAKANRSMGEYCWTCSSSLIRYILREYKHDICTYIDADMYFYRDPQILVDEMLAAGKSVMITPHRFPKDKEYLAKRVGKYCVEFNTFVNNEEGIKVLEYWRNRCLECCSNKGDGIHWGDQKYLEEFESRFDRVHVCENPGAGIAPWNVSLYKLVSKTNTNMIRYVKSSDNIHPIFFHYQGVQYITRKDVIISIASNQKNIDYKLVDSFYIPYLNMIEEKKIFLENKYGILYIIKSHPSDKPISKLRRIFHKTWVHKVFILIYQSMHKKQDFYVVNID